MTATPAIVHAVDVVAEPFPHLVLLTATGKARVRLSALEIRGTALRVRNNGHSGTYCHLTPDDAAALIAFGVPAKDQPKRSAGAWKRGPVLVARKDERGGPLEVPGYLKAWLGVVADDPDEHVSAALVHLASGLSIASDVPGGGPALKRLGDRFLAEVPELADYREGGSMSDTTRATAKRLVAEAAEVPA